MAEAKDTTLGDLCTIIDCEHKTAPTKESGIPLIRTPNIGRGRLILGDVQRISERTFKIWTRRGEPRTGDLIMAREAPVGNVAIVPPNEKVCLGQRTVLIRVKDPNVDPGYLNYLLNSTAMNAYVNLLSNGATVGHLNVSDIRKLKLPALPKIVSQRKITAILAAYDELIENNNRRIALLEKLAEEIYREWYVRLRFRAYEKTPTNKSVPTGWDVLALSEVVSINPPERLDKSEDSPYVGMEDLSVSSLFFRSKVVRKGGQGSKFRNRDVLFPRITPSVENGKRGFVMCLKDGQVGLGSTEFIVFREKVITAEHIYFLTCSPDFRKHAELSMTGASGRQRVQEDCFSFFLVKTPPADIRRQFSDLVRPHFSKIHLLSEQIDKLVASRDLLLPRLISGKLPVEGLDIQFPPGMTEEWGQNSDLTHHA